jgi:hypothetical protein
MFLHPYIYKSFMLGQDAPAIAAADVGLCRIEHLVDCGLECSWNDDRLAACWTGIVASLVRLHMLGLGIGLYSNYQ